VLHTHRAHNLLESITARTKCDHWVSDLPRHRWYTVHQQASHTLALMVPYLPFDSPHKTFKRDYEMRPISKYVVGLLVRAVTVKGRQKAKQFFQQLIQRYPLFAATEGIVFENLVHGLLTTGPVIKLYNLPLPNPSIQRLSSPGPADISIAFEQILSRGNVFYDLSNLAD